LPETKDITRHLDGLRIIAASAVVVLHYSDYVEDFSAGHFMLEHAHHFNWFVDLFFVVSGFVIASQYLDKVGDPPSIGRFLWRRLARIYPLHLATLAFYTVLAVAVHFGLARTDNPARYLLSDIPTQLLLLHAFDGERLTFNFPSWSLSAEMFCYVIFPIMALLAARRREAVVVLVAILALANSLYSAFSGSEPWTEWINKGGAFRALPAFTLGVASYLFRYRIARWPLVPGALLAVLAAFILFGWLLSDMAALVVVYAIAILAIQCDTTGTSTLLTRLRLDRGSVYTYSCYMLHIPVATIVLTLGSRNLVAVFPEAKLALLPVAVAVLAVASILSYRLFETPLRRSLNSAYDRHFASQIAVPAISSQEKSP
jgi:peptidoglycan/LPS O-acetylase OafA/YrhL